MRTFSSIGSSTTFRDTAFCAASGTGWETKLRLYLTVDHRSYSNLHDIADEHERLAAVALEGDTEAFRRELAQHFQSALRAHTEDPEKAPVAHD